MPNRQLNILLFLWILGNTCHAQEANKTVYKYHVGGAGVSQTQNTFLSPLSFTGLSLTFASGKMKEWDNQLQSSFLEFRLASYSHSNKLSNLNQLSIAYTYNRYFSNYALTVFDGFLIRPGIGYNGELCISSKPSNINNSFYYNLNNIIQAGFILTKEHNGYHFSNEFSLPIVGLYATSGYASPVHHALYEEDADIISAFKIGSLETNTIIRNNFSVDIEAHTKRKVMTLRLNYTLTYGKLKTNNIVNHQAFHQFGIGYLFNRKPYVY